MLGKRVQRYQVLLQLYPCWCCCLSSCWFTLLASGNDGHGAALASTRSSFSFSDFSARCVFSFAIKKKKTPHHPLGGLRVVSNHCGFQCGMSSSLCFWVPVGLLCSCHFTHYFSSPRCLPYWLQDSAQMQEDVYLDCLTGSHNCVRSNVYMTMRSHKPSGHIYSHALHNDISVNDKLHIQWWPHEMTMELPYAGVPFFFFCTVSLFFLC